MANPLDRRKTDSRLSWIALQDYAALGTGRSLEKLVQRWANLGPTKHLSVVKGWSAKYDWQARIQSYDAEQAAALESERAAIRKARRIALEEADWRDGEELRTRVGELLDEMPKFLRRTETQVEQGGELVRVITLALAAGPGELARALKIASEIQRLSVGEPTEIHRLVESEVESLFDKLKNNLSDEEYARVVAILSGAAPASE